MERRVTPIQVAIRPFQSTDQGAAKKLILDGLVEHWGFLDPTKNPDLDNIQRSYAGCTILVAWVDRTLAGTGILIPRRADTGEIVRMSVARELRRCGIGAQILNALIQEAKNQGLRKIILETTASWQGVIEFYLSNGFRITHYYADDVYFVKEIGA
jgi:GNAT superfamily N-acetyltransferase